MSIRIGTWNMRGKSANWPLAAKLPADVLLLQEAPPAPVGLPGSLHLHPFEDGKRPWGTAIWSRDLPLRPLPSTTSIRLPATWPGTVAAAETDLLTGGVLTLISVHAVGDHHPIRSRNDGYSTSTLHHALSDVTGYLADRGRHGRMRGLPDNRLVFGGDLNINPGWDLRKGTTACQNALDRITSWGLRSVLPVRPDATYATCPRTPYPQIDYLFFRDDLPEPSAWLETSGWIDQASDHRPLIAELR